MNPSSDIYTNEMLKYIQDEEKNISGLIIVTDNYLTSNSTYSKPRLISLVNKNDGDSIRAFSVQKSAEMKIIAIEHSFNKRCDILEPLINSYLVVALSWLAVLVAYWIHAFIVMKEHSMTLQRTLILIPSIKLAESLINALFLNHCPRLSSLNNPEDKYIEMSRISIVTLTYTILLSFISVLSKGWQTVSFQLTRDQATSLTIMLASIYLSYSAYFLSLDFQNITMFMKVVMAILYIVLGYKNWRNTKR